MGDVISTIQLHMSETYQKPESIAGLAKPVGFTNSTLELIRASEALSMSAQQFFETYGGEIVVLYSTDPVFGSFVRFSQPCRLSGYSLLLIIPIRASLIGNSYCYGEAVPGET
jgi:hypothetical protein